MNPHCPFHLAFPVDDLRTARQFYGDVLGCPIGRESDHWIDFDFHGHQITAHLSPGECRQAQRNPVDGESIPVRHFGLVLPWERWQELARILRDQDVPFQLQPTVRFAGKTGEQGTFFVNDPAGNVLEFKSFRNSESMFARPESDPMQ